MQKAKFKSRSKIVEICRSISESKTFQNFIILTIILSAILSGAKTYQSIYQDFNSIIYSFDFLILFIFTFEIIIRIVSYGRAFWLFFKSPWNVFDFVVTAIFYVPGLYNYASVLRIARVLRILRLITVVPRLRMLVGALLHSIPSMGYVGILLFLHFYVYAIIGNTMFGANDPTNFGNLHTAMMTLFQIVTLEGWADIMEAQGEGFFVWLYFVSFILIGTMVILNLLIGAILNGFEDVKKEIDQEILVDKKIAKSTSKELKDIKLQLEVIAEKIEFLSKRGFERKVKK
ncbi:MAG: ion transporter [Patescibacteria group bacterium]|nr:ion transporter [Patescibacteria group bacterium]